MPFVPIDNILRVACLALLLALAGACVRRVDVNPANFVKTQRYWYVQADSQQWYVIVRNPRDLAEAMKQIKPGPRYLGAIRAMAYHPTGASPKAAVSCPLIVIRCVINLVHPVNYIGQPLNGV
jgi:hypothetical protein